MSKMSNIIGLVPVSVFLLSFASSDLKNPKCYATSFIPNLSDKETNMNYNSKSKYFFELASARR